MVLQCREELENAASIHQDELLEAVRIGPAHLEFADLLDWEPHEEKTATRRMTARRHMVMSLGRIVEADDHLPSPVILYRLRYVFVQYPEAASFQWQVDVVAEAAANVVAAEELQRMACSRRASTCHFQYQWSHNGVVTSVAANMRAWELGHLPVEEPIQASLAKTVSVTHRTVFDGET